MTNDLTRNAEAVDSIMTRIDIPTLVVGITVCTYWFNVAKMVRRVSRASTDVSTVLVPAQRREKYMWLIWVPLIATWMIAPVASAAWEPARQSGLIGLPAWAASGLPALVFRWIAAVIGVACLALSNRCWSHMGDDWRMSVDPGQSARLIIDGPFSRVRHPIYALSITLMICTMIVLPAPVMLVLGMVHIALMNMKARNEEQFLIERHGEDYAAYCARTNRFFPRLGSSGSEAGGRS